MVTPQYILHTYKVQPAFIPILNRVVIDHYVKKLR